MKNITLSAQEETIEKAREVATQRHSTLNAMFREWLEDVASQPIQNEKIADKLNALWRQTSYLRVGKKLSRQAMNER